MNVSLSGLSLRDLEYALAVAQTRHFGRAADRCGVSQPGLSEQIRKLEALLGVVLFERGRRGVQVTEQGAALLARAERVLAEAHGMLEMARGNSEPMGRTVRLSAIQTLGPYYLPFLLRQVRAAHPELALRLEEGRTEALLDSLRTGGTDLVLAALPLPEDGLTTVALFREPFILVCPAGHRLASLPRLSLPDLATDGLILLEEGHCLRDHALSLCAEAAPLSRQATSVETLWHMILAGEGFSMMPALSLAGRAAMDELVTCRDLPEPEASRTIALAWRRTDPRGGAFAELAAQLGRTVPDGVQQAVHF
jgi:LysR family hydrogen peroxide-inducible transcriptional activator